MPQVTITIFLSFSLKANVFAIIASSAPSASAAKGTVALLSSKYIIYVEDLNFHLLDPYICPHTAYC